MKDIGNTIWNILVTTMIYYLMFILFNQYITTDEITLSLLLSGIITIPLKFMISTLIRDLVDFKFWRETIVVVIESIILSLCY